ncbi:hypothetical protein BH23ACT8_BH23ACT8_06000 [soil metagenome]
MTLGCHDVEPVLSAYLDGELDTTAPKVRRHLDGCARCRDELDRLAAVRSLVRSMPVRRLPPTLRADLPLYTSYRADHPRTSRKVSPYDAGLEQVGVRAARALAALAVAAGLVGGAAFGLGGRPASDAVVQVPMDAFVADHVVHTVDAPVGIPVLADAQP